MTILKNYIRLCVFWGSSFVSTMMALGPDGAQLLETLTTLQDANVAQKQIRFWAKGQKEPILELFNAAKEKKLARAELFTAGAYACNGWEAPDFRLLNHYDQLASFNLTFVLSNSLLELYKKSYPFGTPLAQITSTVQSVLEKAAREGSVWAALTQLLNNTPSSLCFWHAAKVRPFLDKPELCSSELFYFYGQALLQYNQYPKDLREEGLTFIKKAGLPYRGPSALNSSDESFLKNANTEHSVSLSPLTRFECINLTAQAAQQLRTLYVGQKIRLVRFVDPTRAPLDCLNITKSKIYELDMFIDPNALDPVSLRNPCLEVTSKQPPSPELAPLVEFTKELLTYTSVENVCAFFRFLYDCPEKLGASK